MGVKSITLQSARRKLWPPVMFCEAEEEKEVLGLVICLLAESDKDVLRQASDNTHISQVIKDDTGGNIIMTRTAQ